MALTAEQRAELEQAREARAETRRATVPALEAWRLADALAGRFNALSTPAA
jgi:hypothetical protein